MVNRMNLMGLNQMQGVIAALCFVLVSLSTAPASAQYFGRNKVQYDNFEFKQFDTEHFTFYFYPEAEEAVKDAARMAERWYERHSMVFLREFKDRKPIILYANDADFHQTNVIRGRLGEGVGGVTESLKQRVVMPLTGIYADTDHVLGHELIHSFQYDIAFAEQGDGEYQVRFNIGQLPLWFIEGTAEYLSVGRDDSHTAMWLRDAALRDDLPTIEDLTRRPHEYFPYRYGQAYMAYIGGKYGDKAVADLYKLSGKVGLDTAFVGILGIKPDSLSTEWQQAVKDAYLPLVEGRTLASEAGNLAISKDQKGGSINIAPSLSPDGRYVAFLSERDLFSINLFIADSETGKIVQRLKKQTADSHFDALRFISSAGTWSPDGTQFAFITFSEGDNEIVIWDIDSGSIDRRIKVDEVTAMMNLSWSPDGQSLAISGMKGGVSDLFILSLEGNEVRQVTADRYADLQPTWSPDGSTIAFVTDRGEEGTDFDMLSYGSMRLATIDLENKEIEVIRPFGNALHHNPQFTPDGRSLFFISDYEGFKDIYRYDLRSRQTSRITSMQTGVSGITNIAPAMTIAAQSGKMAFTVFSDNEYTIYTKESEEIEGTPVHALLAQAEMGTSAFDGGPLGELAEGIAVDSSSVGRGYQSASILPPYREVDEGIVGSYLSDASLGLPDDPDYDVKEYSSKLKLDYVAPPSVGVSIGGPFGGGLAGSVGFYFSDMLGNNSLGISVLANGTFKDIGGQVTYLNQKNRLNYGFYGAHIPIIYGVSSGFGTLSSGEQVINQVLQRLFIDQVGGYTSYPLSTTRRLELSSSFIRYGFDNEVRTFSLGGSRIDAGLNVANQDPLYLGQMALAYVKDNSSFGFTSPVSGSRQRAQISTNFGTEQFSTLTLDARRYFFAKPVTFAVRGLHVGNYGANSDDVFAQEYLGSPYYQSFIRGYNLNNFDVSECSSADCPEANRLNGTRVAVASAEVRVPLFGNESLGLINFAYLPTEIALFTDVGLAWTQDDAPILSFARDRDDPGRVPLVSAGVSSRFNLFGSLVFEVYYAYPFQRPGKGGHWGLQFLPGW